MLDIEDYWELLALHRTIMMAKFGEPTNREILTSPFLASAARKILQATIEADIKRRGEAKTNSSSLDLKRPNADKTKSTWLDWKKADENRLEWRKLTEELEHDIYKTLDEDKVASIIRDIIAPLEITDEQVFTLINGLVKNENN